MFLADALSRAYLPNGNENGEEFKTKKAHSLYQVHSSSSPTADVSTTPPYHPTTARRTWKGKVEAAVKVARRMLRKTAKFGHDQHLARSSSGMQHNKAKIEVNPIISWEGVPELCFQLQSPYWSRKNP